jgi:predicted CXXCH cytochrome family protein
MGYTSAPMSGPRDELICHCAAVSRRQIEAALAATPDASLEVLGSQLKCGVACGCCRPLLRELMGQSPWLDVAHVTRRPLTDEREHERRIVELELTFAPGGGFPRAAPGQHAVLQARIDGEWVTRTYTIVRQSPSGTSLVIAMRRTPGGQLTPRLLDTADEALAELPLRVAGPTGGGQLQSSRPAVCFVAGVGVTLAMSLLNARPAGQRLHFDYSAVRRGDMAYAADLEAAAEVEPAAVSCALRTAEEHGFVTEADVADAVRRFPQARFIVCGPAGFMESVCKYLRRAKVPDADAVVEAFFITPPARPPRDMRRFAYLAGAALALGPFTLLAPQLSDYVPSNQHNPGHAELACQDCHAAAPGTLRQQLQAKAKYLVGMRETSADFGMRSITNKACLDCHANPDDRHPSHRFLEPRFAAARQALAPHRCMSCHREHVANRLSRPDTGFCVNCHRDLVVKDDPTTPPHQALIDQARWNTCLTCHDFHGNHNHAPPKSLDEALTPERLAEYLSTAESPYGERVVKAKKQEERR